MIDHRKRQIDKARREHRRIEQENVTFEQAQTNAKQNMYPVGSVYAWAAQIMFGPINSENKEKNNAQ